MAFDRSIRDIVNTQAILPMRQRRSSTNSESGLTVDSTVNNTHAIAERCKKQMMMKLKENSSHTQNSTIKAIQPSSTASARNGKSKMNSTASVCSVGSSISTAKSMTSVGSNVSKMTSSTSVSSNASTVKSKTKKKATSSTATKKSSANITSSNRQVKASKEGKVQSDDSQDIVWKGFRSKSIDDSSVAGSLQGSWASIKSHVSSSASVAKSTASYHVRSNERIESKRRNSESALSSLSRGNLLLSPFVKDTLRNKYSRSVKTLQDNDSHSCRRKKKVRFAESSEGIQNSATASFPSRLKLTPDNIRLLWWTSEERQTMKRRAQRIGLRFLSITAKYHLAVEQILSKCKSGKQDTKNQFFAEKDAIRILINHDARGLELAMVSALNLDSCRHYHRCVKQSVTCVLNAQSMWKCTNLKSDDEQWQMIATMLQQYSVVATRFARILAEGDARFVRGHYTPTDGDMESSSIATSLTEESSLSTSSSSECDYLDGSFTI